MNPGYVASVLLLMTVILIVFGWKQHLLGNLPKRGVVLFILGWIYCTSVTWTFQGNTISATMVWFSLLAVAVLISQWRKGLQWWIIVSASVLIAAIYLLLKQVLDYYPMWVLFGEVADVAILLSICIFLLSRDWHKQIGLISLGLLLGEILYVMLTDSLYINLGGPAQADLWWLTFLLGRAWSEAAAACSWLLERAKL